MEALSHDPHDDDSELREELVAYLDGELGMEQSRRVEERAAVQPDTRRMLEDFDRTWHLLDELETPATNEDFTRTTLEMVYLAVAEDNARLKQEVPRARRRARLWSLAGLAAAAAAGYFLVAALAPDPNAQLLQDLRLLENYDQYRDIGSIEFLRALCADNPFPKDSAAAAPVPAYNAAETIVQRRQLVEGMTTDQRKDLFDTERNFERSPDERQRMRDLQAAIESDPDREKLLVIMNRYCDWFDGQPLTVQSALEQLKPAARVAAVRKQIERGTIARDEVRLDAKSRLGLTHWMDRYTTEHEARILQEWARARGGQGRPPNGPPRPGPGNRSEADTAAAPHPQIKLSPQRKRQIVREWLQRSLQPDNAAQHPRFSKDDLDNLRKSLSDPVRTKLEKYTPDEQLRVIRGWLRETLSPEFDEQLFEFFEKIPPEVRDRLMSLPVDEMYHELDKMFTRQGNTGNGPRFGDHRPDRGFRGGRSGPRGSGGRRWADNQGVREASPSQDSSGGKEPAAQDSGTSKPAEKPPQ